MTIQEDELVKNEPVRENLRENGDNCETPRPVEHYAYFLTQEGLASYRGFLAARGYQIDREDIGAGNDGRLVIVFSQVQAPVAIDPETALLDKQAAALGGEYDGWVTDIIRQRP